MSAAYEESKPLADKFKQLVQGYAVHNAKKGDTLGRSLTALNDAEIELESFLVRIYILYIHNNHYCQPFFSCSLSRLRAWCICTSTTHNTTERYLSWCPKRHVVQELERMEKLAFAKREEELRHAIATHRNIDATLQNQVKMLFQEAS